MILRSSGKGAAVPIEADEAGSAAGLPSRLPPPAEACTLLRLSIAIARPLTHCFICGSIDSTETRITKRQNSSLGVAPADSPL